MEFSKKPVQLVRHMHEVLPGYKKAVAAGDKYMVQVKYDGVFGFAIYEDGPGWQIYGRTGKKLSNVGLLELQMQCFRTYAVYIGEICWPGHSLEELSGVVNPNRTKPLDDAPDLHFHLHDLVDKEDFLRGSSTQPAKSRYDELSDVFRRGYSAHPSVLLIANKQNVDETRIRLIAEAVIDKGYEGVVVKNQQADWKAGRKNHTSMKIVRGCDYDLRCIRVEEGLGKRQGMVANAICLWRRFGEPTGDIMEIPVDLGKGFTDERRKELWADQSQIVGKVVEVHALQVGSQGSLRLPKVNSIRVDKEEADL